VHMISNVSLSIVFFSLNIPIFYQKSPNYGTFLTD